ncbi:hypothetical protein KB20921_05110 [Edwardsiella ictaluri]|nr:hypothetical protein KB20921_05110 [Edwardsiella ictaluri]BEI04723.1 hypothetical protein KH201010_05090 [Edwardsiella ictaluri]
MRGQRILQIAGEQDAAWLKLFAMAKYNFAGRGKSGHGTKLLNRLTGDYRAFTDVLKRAIHRSAGDPLHGAMVPLRWVC